MKFIKRILLCVLLIGMLFIPAQVAKAYEPANYDKIVSSQLDISKKWTATISKNVLTVEITDQSAGNGRNASLQCSSLKVSDWKKFNNHKVTFSVDFSSKKKGKYEVDLYEARKDSDTSIWSFASFTVQVKNGKASFYSAYGQHEIDFLDSITETYNPEDYNSLNSNMKAVSCIDDITSQAKKLTKKCKTDEEKVKAIHDYICENYAYAYDALYSSDYNDTINAADPEWVFKNKRAVCSGFSRLSAIMLRSLGIPCLNISGYASGATVSGSLPKSMKNVDSNHEWILIYLDDEWKIFDFTWDCGNKYYGKNDSRNVSDQAPSYDYYGIAAADLGSNHYSMSMVAESSRIRQKSYSYFGSFKQTFSYDELQQGKKTFNITIQALTGKDATLKKLSGNKKITVAENGKITVKKGIKKGEYKVKVQVNLPGNDTYEDTVMEEYIYVTVK